jgi:hypothetical protein
MMLQPQSLQGNNSSPCSGQSPGTSGSLQIYNEYQKVHKVARLLLPDCCASYDQQSFDRATLELCGLDYLSRWGAAGLGRFGKPPLDQGGAPRARTN